MLDPGVKGMNKTLPRIQHGTLWEPKQYHLAHLAVEIREDFLKEMLHVLLKVEAGGVRQGKREQDM